jgi:rubredoxin
MTTPHYTCDVCGLTFGSEEGLREHKVSHAGMSATAQHTCNICGERFDSEGELRAHKREHGR